MNELLSRVRELYVAPGQASVPGVWRRSMAPPPAAAVLGSPDQAAPTAAGLALGMRRAGGWPCALVALWGVDEPPAWRLPAGRAARRLATLIQADGLEADASGRLVRAWLPGPPAAAAVAAERVSAATRAPVALALCGPREPEVDRLLRRQDVVLVACRPQDDPALAVIAQDSLAGLPAPIRICEATCGRLTRALALAGARPPAALRATLRPALEAVT